MFNILSILKSKLFYAKDVFAQESYELLQAIPKPGPNGDTITETTGLNYLQNLFMILIGATTVIAVILIVAGGLKYMSTDAWSGKTEGKEMIKNALLGLLLAGASYLILYTINPKLIEINLDPKEIPPTEQAAFVEQNTLNYV